MATSEDRPNHPRMPASVSTRRAGQRNALRGPLRRAFCCESALSWASRTALALVSSVRLPPAGWSPTAVIFAALSGCLQVSADGERSPPRRVKRQGTSAANRRFRPSTPRTPSAVPQRAFYVGSKFGSPDTPLGRPAASVGPVSSAEIHPFRGLPSPHSWGRGEGSQPRPEGSANEAVANLGTTWDRAHPLDGGKYPTTSAKHNAPASLIPRLGRCGGGPARRALSGRDPGPA